jgi:hypothetical protein
VVAGHRVEPDIRALEGRDRLFERGVLLRTPGLCDIAGIDDKSGAGIHGGGVFGEFSQRLRAARGGLMRIGHVQKSERLRGFDRRLLSEHGVCRRQKRAENGNDAEVSAHKYGFLPEINVPSGGEDMLTYADVLFCSPE